MKTYNFRGVDHTVVSETNNYVVIRSRNYEEYTTERGSTGYINYLLINKEHETIEDAYSNLPAAMSWCQYLQQTLDALTPTTLEDIMLLAGEGGDDTSAN